MRIDLYLKEENMSKLAKLAGVASIAALLSACGGGSDSKLDTPNDNYIKPGDVSSTFIPFKDKDFLTKLKETLGFSESLNVMDDRFNQALGHMIGETLGDGPITRTGRVIELTDQGTSAFTIFRNLICTELTKSGTTQTIKLKSGNDSCATSFGKEVVTFKGGSISLTETLSSTTVEFNNALYTPWTDTSKLYLVTGKIVKDTVGSNGAIYSVKDPLKFQIVDKNNPSTTLEYMGLQDYEYRFFDEQLQSVSSKGTIVGQPKDANFSYAFNFSVTHPFEKESWRIYPKAGGKLEIIDEYNQKIVVEQTKDYSSSASVRFNSGVPTNVSWSDIVKKK